MYPAPKTRQPRKTLQQYREKRVVMFCLFCVFCGHHGTLVPNVTMSPWRAKQRLTDGNYSFVSFLRSVCGSRSNASKPASRRYFVTNAHDHILPFKKTLPFSCFSSRDPPPPDMLQPIPYPTPNRSPLCSSHPNVQNHSASRRIGLSSPYLLIVSCHCCSRWYFLFSDRLAVCVCTTV